MCKQAQEANELPEAVKTRVHSVSWRRTGQYGYTMALLWRHRDDTG